MKKAIIFILLATQYCFTCCNKETYYDVRSDSILPLETRSVLQSENSEPLFFEDAGFWIYLKRIHIKWKIFF